MSELTDNDNEPMIVLPQRWVDQLLQVCVENGVEVPEDLKSKLLAQQKRFAGCTANVFQTHTEVLVDKRDKELESLTNDPLAQAIKALVDKLHINLPPLELRVKNGSYKVTQIINDDPLCNKNVFNSDNEENDEHVELGPDSSTHSGPKRATQKIPTVGSESPLTKLFYCVFRCIRNKGDLRKKTKAKTIMDGINLVLEQGKMYLVLGAPGSGKSTLLKMISHILPVGKGITLGGEVTLSGYSSKNKNIWWTSLVSYIDQIDRLHPYLTVFETFKFAWFCRSGGTHFLSHYGSNSEVMENVATMDKELFVINKTLEYLGLSRVKDTFVGDQSRVRGVSGGEKRRVTVGEMFVIRTPIICCDEISTGLDAATTYDITRFMSLLARIIRTTKVVSLLQPPPETVANFDEIVLLSQGQIIYAGPVDEVEKYFNSLGYFIPERMDLADWLQTLPTPDGAMYLEEGTSSSRHLTSEEFHDRFYSSARGKAILSKLHGPPSNDTSMIENMAGERYKNSALTSLRLVIRREVLLWWRDKYQIKAKIIQTLIMSVVVGTVFFQANVQSIISVLYQSMFFTALSSIMVAVKQFEERPIFYKQQDANFFPTWCYVVARAATIIPYSVIDSLGYGTIIYFLVGLAFNDGASIARYFMFVLLMFCTSLTSAVFYGLFSACIKSITSAQAAMAVSLLILMIFSGFTVQPDVIPNYFIWIYHINFFAWMFRGFVVNEFDSGKYHTIVGEQDGLPITLGETILTRFGFFDRNGNPYTLIWSWWAVLFSIAFSLSSLSATILLFSKIRFTAGKSLVDEEGDNNVDEMLDSDMVTIPFTKMNLTFTNIHYTVTSSITNEKLELLKGVDGVVEAGKMTALMGSSGAGKTTIMDVIAMRKSTGEISGEIRLNGHLQEETSFRRCMGYVEQFDTQSPQLTIRETCEFSARLRLDQSDRVVAEETLSKLVQQSLNLLELTNIQDLQVGTDAFGGLSFEQRKRLSIAVELVANPSILFLDEPTSGLDARAAAVVMRGLKRVALSGRAICATIHQPSISVFGEFDRLLLLKRGGEVVFFGDIGPNCRNLIDYFEGYDETPRIQPGENPSTWMLTTIGAGSTIHNKKPFDYSGNYFESDLHDKCLNLIQSINATATNENKVSFPSKYATTYSTQAAAVFARAFKVYYRSPSYNSTRMVVSAVVALLFGSVYASQRVPENESDMNSRINSLFMGVLFLSVNAQNTVLAIFEVERNMFYRHKAANMYTSLAVIRAFTLSELPFIIAASVIFSVLFYFMLGFALDAEKFFLFWAFVFLSLSNFTFIGQMLVSLLRDSATAQGFGGLCVTFTSLFCGILIRPGDIPTFWIFMYWITPGHYIFEGIFMSQFTGDTTPIVATPGSPFFERLGCTSADLLCVGTAEQWITSNFTTFSRDNVKWNALFLVMLLLVTRCISFYALATINHKSN